MVLERIDSPSDVKNLTKGELHQLARDIREEVISTVSEKGGHLGPNLGVTELAIALHYIYDSPKDKIIWDVGHQSYPHKLLTGRREKFSSLRSIGGITGYPRIVESPHDAFGTGHSSTSISAALGMATARDLQDQEYKVVAIIGDGAMTGGMSFEALNHAGHEGRDMLVILNDNQMSISKNVGALSKYLSNIVVNPKYADVRNNVRDFIMKLPGIGEVAAETVGDIEGRLRSLSKLGMYFTALGWKYFGPVYGNNLEVMIKALRNVKKIPGPVLLHVSTQKGKGYHPAESDKEKYHGVSPFHVSNGENKKSSSVMNYTDAFTNAMIALATDDSRIVGITAAMPKGTGLDSFGKKFPTRCFDVGIAEQHAVTFAAGLARQGMKPVAAIYSTFLQRGYDQLIHDVCLQNLDVTFALDRSGLVGEDGPTQHGSFDLSYLSAIPNLVVMSPKDENELGHLLATAIGHEGPAAIRYPRGKGLGVAIDQGYHMIPVGKAEVLSSGKDVTLLAIGSMVSVAAEAAIELSQKGISCEVINARFVKPLDSSTILSSVKKTKKLVTLEENALNGGFGSLVLQLLNENKVFIPVKQIGLSDSFIEHGPVSEVRERAGLGVRDVVKTTLELMK